MGLRGWQWVVVLCCTCILCVFAFTSVYATTQHKDLPTTCTTIPPALPPYPHPHLPITSSGRRGSAYKPSKVAQDPSAIKPIIYYGYELSPFCKLVREALSELELPHLYRCTPRGSPKRQELFEKRGVFQAPYIEV